MGIRSAYKQRLILCLWALLILLACPGELLAEQLLTPEMTGRMRVASTQILPTFFLLAGDSIEGYKGQDFAYAGDQFGLLTNRLFLIYGLLPNLQARFDMKYARGQHSLTTPGVLSVFGDSEIGLRYARPVIEQLRIGGELTGLFYAGVPGQSSVFDGGRADLRQIASYRYKQFCIEQNLGFIWDRSANIFNDGPTFIESATYDLGQFNRVALGLRPHVQLSRFLPYVDLHFDFPLAAPLAARRGNKQIGPGLGLSLPKNMLLNASVRAALERPQQAGYPLAPAWQAVFAFAYSIDGSIIYKAALDRIKTYPSTVNVAVIDAKRRIPVHSARIRLYTPKGVIEEDGVASWRGIADRVTYEVSAPYYVTGTGTIMLQEGKTVGYDVQLEPTHAWVRGVVSTPSGDGLAVLALSGPSGLVTGAIETSFKWPLLPGAYSGYLTAPDAASMPINFELSLSEMLNLGELDLLTPRAAAEQLGGNSKVKETVVYMPPPPGEVVYLFSDEVAVGQFTVGETRLSEKDRQACAELAERVKSDPEISHLIIQGGADDTGTPSTNVAIARNRAYAVFQELRKNGVPAEKLAVKVQYFLRGVEESTPEQRAFERRVTVEIIKR